MVCGSILSLDFFMPYSEAAKVLTFLLFKFIRNIDHHYLFLFVFTSLLFTNLGMLIKDYCLSIYFNSLVKIASMALAAIHRALDVQVT